MIHEPFQEESWDRLSLASNSIAVGWSLAKKTIPNLEAKKYEYHRLKDVILPGCLSVYNTGETDMLPRQVLLLTPLSDTDRWQDSWLFQERTAFSMCSGAGTAESARAVLQKLVHSYPISGLEMDIKTVALWESLVTIKHISL